VHFYVVIPGEVFVELPRFDLVQKCSFDEVAFHDFAQHEHHYGYQSSLAVGPHEAYDELTSEVVHGPVADHLHFFVSLCLGHVPVGDAWFELDHVSELAQGSPGTTLKHVVWTDLESVLVG